MKGKIKNSPIVVWLYILSCGCTLFNSLVSMITAGRYVAGSLVSVIVTLAVDVFVIWMIMNNKKNKALFIIYAVSCASSLLIAISGLSAISLFSFLSVLLSTLIIGTITMPQLAKYKELAKKFYFVPAIISLVSGIILTARALEYVSNSVAMTIFTSCLLSPALSFYFASWCVKEEEEIPAPNQKQKSLFKGFVILAIASSVIGIIMSIVGMVSGGNSSSNESYSSSSSSSSGSSYSSSYGSSSSGSSYGSSYGSSSSGSSYGGSYNSSSSSSGKQYGAGGYEMPNENDKSFADYVQRVDPDLYDAMQENYNNAVADYYN